MVKLTDLDPSWLSADGRERMGVLFQCPMCRDTNHGHGIGHFVGVYFANPPDGGPAALPKHVPQPRWQRTGETFETLTLSPSVNVGGCWHGFVRSGEVTSC